MAKKKAAKTTPQAQETPMYGLTLTVGGKTYTSQSGTMEQALISLERPAKILGKGTLVIRKGEKTRERVLVMPQIKRLFYPLAQKVIAKQLIVGL